MIEVLLVPCHYSFLNKQKKLIKKLLLEIKLELSEE